MKKRKNLRDLGERGFLKALLPRLRRLKSHRFRVPPGDDAAVLAQPAGLVLTIDGLTEGTHFLSSWKRPLAKKYGLSLARVLGWKLLGRSLSDLAAMGPTTERWAMISLGAPAGLDEKFLMDFFRGVKEAAQAHDCALAGGDTMRARALTLVAAAGGRLLSPRAVERSGARPGDLICVAGEIGDAAAGLDLLKNKWRISSRADATTLVHRFFRHRPRFSEARHLTVDAGVTSMIDLSDSLEESVSLVCEASRVGAWVNVNLLPISPLVKKYGGRRPSLLSAGEDYALMFTLRRNRLTSLVRRLPFSVIGEISKGRARTYVWNGKPCVPPRSFRHF